MKVEERGQKIENTLPYVEPLAVSDKCTLLLENLVEDKIRLTSTSLVEEKLILLKKVLEVRSLEGRIPIAHKERLPDAKDPSQVSSNDDPYQLMTTSWSRPEGQRAMSNDVTAPRSLRPGAARTSEYRRRRREGLRQVTIELGRVTIGKLERNGYLEDRRDSSKLADAVELFISDHMPKQSRR